MAWYKTGAVPTLSSESFFGLKKLHFAPKEIAIDLISFESVDTTISLNSLDFIAALIE